MAEEKFKKPCPHCGGKGYVEYYDATDKTCGQCKMFALICGKNRMEAETPAQGLLCFVPIEEEG